MMNLIAVAEATASPLGPYAPLIVAVAVIALGIVFVLILPKLERGGVDVGASIATAREALSTLNATIEVVKPLLPDNGASAILDTITKVAGTAVGQAEQLYHIEKLDGEDRKDAARSYIVQALEISGVEVTPEVDVLIEGAIQSEVLKLGHKSKQE